MACGRKDHWGSTLVSQSTYEVDYNVTPDSYLYGWVNDEIGWKKLLCNEAGKLIIDPTEILEDDPQDGHLSHAPTANWAHDHGADADAHHAKYTDAEAEAAAKGWVEKTVIYEIGKELEGDRTVYIDLHASDGVDFSARIIRWGGVNGIFDIGQTGTGIARFDGVNVKAHAANAAAHHAKYTDAEAQAACGLSGDLYWSCLGICFDAMSPSVNDVTKEGTGSIYINAANISLICGVSLPHDATIGHIVVYGNAAAEDKTWVLYRINLTSLAAVIVAGASINTQNDAPAYTTVNNNLYGYLFWIADMDIGDKVYGARIIYTI